MSFLKKLMDSITNKTGFLTSKFKEGLKKTKDAFVERVEGIFQQHSKIDEDFYEELEEVLISADIGVKTATLLIDLLRKEVKEKKIEEPQSLKPIFIQKLMGILASQTSRELMFAKEGLTIILIVGVNGVGKTTSIGKLAYNLKAQGKNVMLAAGDTFRAGAIEQLEVWSQRVGVELVKQQPGSDPAAVIFDAIQTAKRQNVDVLLCDTAGRLQNKVNLMEELNKIFRVIQREIPEGPHEVLMVLDATTGQNALSQAKLFTEKVNLTGMILTKLDGTAKGGIVIAISQELKIPVKFVGLGEQKEDLASFEIEQFIHALFAEWIEEANA